MSASTSAPAWAAGLPLDIGLDIGHETRGNCISLPAAPCSGLFGDATDKALRIHSSPKVATCMYTVAVATLPPGVISVLQDYSLRVSPSLSSPECVNA